MKYSVITVNYNNREGLRRTMESVVGQTCRDFEYIVIDGGSTDGSADLLREHESELSYWVTERDRGVYHAMNKGIRRARGEYLIFMNSGDTFYDNDVLACVLPLLTADIVHGRLFYYSGRERTVYLRGEPTLQHFLDNTLNHQAAFIARRLFEGTMYDERYKIVSDWKFFMQKLIVENCSFRSIDVKVGRFEEGGISESDSLLDARERSEVLAAMFPPRMVATLERFKGRESPMLDLIPQFNRTDRLQKVIIRTVKAIIAIHKWIKR